MKNTNFLMRTAAFALLFITIVSSGQAVEFYLKLGSGLGFVRPETLDALITDWQTWHKKEAERAVKFAFLSGEASKFRMTTDFDAEFLAALTPRLHIGLAGGILYGEIPQAKTELTIEKELGTFIQVHPVELTALPFALVGYYILPIGGQWSAFIKAGAGKIFAKFSDRDGRRLTTNENFSYQETQTASGQGPYFVGGLGLRVLLSTGLSLVAEVEGRSARIRGFTGEKKDGTLGSLYTYEAYDSQLDFWQAKVQIHESPPAGEAVRSVGETLVDLSGFRAKISLLIRF
jgi:hypothetical protein